MATTDELNKAYTNAQNSFASPSTTGTNNVNTGAYTTATTGAINQMYDAQQKANEAQLKNAYETNMSNAQATKDSIAPQYQTAANDAAIQYERQRQAFNRNAAANGINSGTASQAALAMGNQQQKTIGNIRTNEANAQAEVDRKMLQLKTEYQNNIQAALANNDHARATALLNEYKNSYDRNLQQAQIMAEFGQFGGYANLFGQEQADAMQQIWTRQNPDLAYYTGAIDANTYKFITGKTPRTMPTGNGTGAIAAGAGDGSGSNYYNDFWSGAPNPYYPGIYAGVYK